jgi:DNA-3-methyladenine glycosylase
MGARALKRGRLGRSFFARPPWVVAPDLLGCVLEHRGSEGAVALRLVEVEAYAGGEDPASHAWRGRTERNAAMYGPPGTLYVYFVYGMHWCLNVVCEPEGTPAAVLLRAGEVVSGADLVLKHRQGRQPWAAGPARLAQALGLDGSADGADLCAVDATTVVRGRASGPPPSVESGPRVGVVRAAETPWRFWIAGDPAVSAFRPGGRTRGRDAGGSGA